MKEKPFDAVIDTGDYGAVILLPTPRASIIKTASRVLLIGPHSQIVQYRDVEWLITTRPEMIKLLFGKVKRFIKKEFDSAKLSELTLFESCTTEKDIIDLLDDGRSSVKKLWDEELFANWWINGMQMSHVDRRMQRVCLRYGGLSPQQINQFYKMGTSLRDYIKNGKAYFDYYSDQSHFIRTCKQMTGNTPAEIKKMSNLFYFFQEFEDYNSSIFYKEE